jgi:hypothetical protein
MKNSIRPLAPIVMPDTKNPGLYVQRASYNQPTKGKYIQTSKHKKN